MAAPGARWDHCIQLQPCSNAPLLCLFSSCVSNKHRICFLFLLLSPKRGFTTHCVLSACLNLLILTGIKRQLSLFTSDHHIALGPPPPAGKASSHFVPEKWVCFLALFVHSSLLPHISTLNFKFFSQGVHFVCLSQKNPVSAQTVFLTQCSGLLVIWGLLLLGWPHHTVTGLALGANLLTQLTAAMLPWTRPQVSTEQSWELRENLTSLFHGSGCRKISVLHMRQHREQCGHWAQIPGQLSAPRGDAQKGAHQRGFPLHQSSPEEGGGKSITPKSLYERHYRHVTCFFISVPWFKQGVKLEDVKFCLQHKPEHHLQPTRCSGEWSSLGLSLSCFQPVVNKNRF